ncbi:unnamed protein product [Caenorhabditis angaria]|uniref:Uncharacterized protein n=1 Tax=Caenorhabditis angaria TaxID=860376 RepID=A0A9P1N398_9PELO|nr:unnamed protein product [Caenorhabditis angaria]
MSTCIINSSLPAYQPNIYLCSSGSTCCKSRGIIACCQNDVTFKQTLEQSVPFFIIWLVIFGAALIVKLFFDDDETDRPVNQTNQIFGLEYIMPNDEDHTVEDPVFGQLFESKIPKFATRSKPE